MGHLEEGTAGRFAKMIFYFLTGNLYSKAKTTTYGRRYNLGDGEGLHVPCKLKLVNDQEFIDLLQDDLIKLKYI